MYTVKINRTIIVQNKLTIFSTKKIYKLEISPFGAIYVKLDKNYCSTKTIC